MSNQAWELGGTHRGSGANFRVPVILCVDTSTSMNRGANGATGISRITELNAALKSWQTSLQAMAYLRRQADIAILEFNDVVRPVTIGPVSVAGFTPVAEFIAPSLEAGGVTRLDLAVAEALKLSANYQRAQDVETRRVKIWILTDGEPTDKEGEPTQSAWKSLVPLIEEAEKNQKVAFYAAGVHGADMKVLKAIAGPGAFDLSGLRFDEVLEAVTRATGAVGQHDTANAEKVDAAAQVNKMQQLFRALGRDTHGA